MNIFCRLFVVAVFCLFTGIVNGMQTVFDLPVDVLGRSHQFIINVNKYVCVIVPETIADTKYNELTSNPSLQRLPFNETLNMLVGTSGFIYFPSDGRQPTTEEAVEWSCANADSHLNDEERLNSPITQWYMKMFGVIPFRNEEDPGPDDFIKAGYDENNNKKRIISYDFETMGTDEGYEVSYHVHHDTQQEETRRKSFIDNFMKIASTSVGRVLLYRILIEIRRKDERGNGCFETESIRSANTTQNEAIIKANKTLTIKYSNSNAYCYPDSKCDDPISNDLLILSNASIKYCNNPKHKTIVVEKKLSNLQYALCKCKRKVDIAVFHELCHWYHSLRNLFRFHDENASDKNVISEINTHIIGKVLYGNLEYTDDRAKVSAMSWTSKPDIISYEELRNIIGLNKKSYSQYIEGDDLCENLYRTCLGGECKIRFSHADDEYIEDAVVIERAIEIINSNKQLYTKNLININNNCFFINTAMFNKPGLGNCFRKGTKSVKFGKGSFTLDENK